MQRTCGVVLALQLGLAVYSASAQTATPAAFPLVPAPEACTGQPVSIEDLGAKLATPPAAAPATPTPLTLPDARPADAATAAEVFAVVHQVFACTNAGDDLRVYAFFTDDFVRDFFAGTALTDEVIAFLTAPPVPLPEDQRRIIRDIGPVQLLADGRAGVLVVLDEPDHPRSEEPDYVILEQISGRWLVDEIHEDTALGTSIAAP